MVGGCVWDGLDAVVAPVSWGGLCVGAFKGSGLIQSGVGCLSPDQFLVAGNTEVATGLCEHWLLHVGSDVEAAKYPTSQLAKANTGLSTLLIEEVPSSSLTDKGAAQIFHPSGGFSQSLEISGKRIMGVLNNHGTAVLSWVGKNSSPPIGGGPDLCADSSVPEGGEEQTWPPKGGDYI